MPRPSPRLLPLNPLRAFEAAARHGSFTRAAAELGVTQGAISRHIRTLEDRLGFPLFQRTPQGLELPPGSRALAATLEDAFGRIARATENLVATHKHAILVVRGYTTFLTRWLIPRLPEFQMRHPEIEVRLVAASDAVDFDRDPVDVAVRYGYGRWRRCHSELLFNDELTPVCSPAYAAKWQASPPEGMLIEGTLLHHNLRLSDWPDWLEASGLAALEPQDGRWFEDLSIIYECARANLGVAMGQRAYVAEDLAAGRLIEPFAFRLRRDLGYYLVCPHDRIDVPKIRLFREWLAGAAPAAATTSRRHA